MCTPASAIFYAMRPTRLRRASRTEFRRFWLRLATSLLISLFGIGLPAQTLARIAQPVSDADLQTLSYSMAPFAQPERDAGRLAGAAPMERILLLLTPSDDQKANLNRLLNAQKDPASRDYRLWLTPQQYGSEFGPADADLQRISAWLQQHGFQVGRIAAGRQWLEFSGPASQVESAFYTEMHQYVVSGRAYIGNATDISLPRALAAVVGGVVSLNNYEKQPMHSGATLVSAGNSGSLVPAGSFTVGASGSVSIDPTYTLISPTGTYHFLSPSDFQNIYNIAPLLKEGTDGIGVSVASPTFVCPMCRRFVRFSVFRPTIRGSSSMGPILAIQETNWKRTLMSSGPGPPHPALLSPMSNRPPLQRQTEWTSLQPTSSTIALHRS